MELYLATRTGFVAVEGSGDSWSVCRRGLNSRHVTTIMAREGVILAGTTDGIFRSDDLGDTWQEKSEGLTARHVRWLAYHPDISDREFAGTEPANIFVSGDGGDSWRACPEVAELRDKFGWWMPYSPEAGCVRGFAFHGQRAYGAVEVGAALRSDDGGESWRLVDGADGQPRFAAPKAGQLHPDVHSIEVHASAPDLVYAPTSGGFFHSADGGASWRQLYANCYARAVWLDPADPHHLILGPSAGSNGRDGRIEVTHDGGASWREVAGRFDHNMVERFQQIGAELWAVMAKGDLLRSPLDALDFRPVLGDVAGVNDLSAMN